MPVITLQDIIDSYGSVSVRCTLCGAVTVVTGSRHLAKLHNDKAITAKQLQARFRCRKMSCRGRGEVSILLPDLEIDIAKMPKDDQDRIMRDRRNR